MSRTASLCPTNRSGRIASWAAQPWRSSSRFSTVSSFNRISKRLTPTNAQTWDYDAVGNWDSVTTNSVTQTRGANRQNEITSVSGATTPTYDNNGNLTKDENDNRFVWDAWNRQVKIKNSSNTVIATNAYDALNHKVQVTTSSGTIDQFFSNNWQVLEGKSGSNTQSRYVWSPVYVDGLVTRDRDTDANGTLDERLFALQDANWNVTGITNTSGTIQERYTETPYGAVTFRDGSGSTISVSTKGWDILHQGAKADIIGDYDFRNRVYSPTLWRWLSNDPLGFEAGDVNTFRYVGNGPGNGLDPLGKENIKEQIVKRHYTFPLVPSIPGGPVAIGQIQIIRVGNSQNNEPIPMWSKIFEKYEFMEQVEKMKKDVKDGEIVTGLVPISLGSISVGVFPGKNMIAIGGRSDRVTFKYPIYWPIYSEIDKNKIIGGFPIDLTIEWKTNFGWRSEEPGAPKDIK